MPAHTEFKFVTTRLTGFGPHPGDVKYFNWADVSEMLTRYGLDGWKVSQMTATKLSEDSVVYSFVLERALFAPQTKRTR